jgi:polar amino acid transport system substrate-binding protein
MKRGGGLWSSLGRLFGSGEQAPQVESSLVKLSMRALWLKDRATYEHSIQVARHASALGKELKCSRAQLEHLWTASLLHDIGKLYVSDRLLQTSGILDTGDMHEVREHAMVGYELLSVVPEMANYLDAVRHHHERWDGRGYPDGLLSEDIPEDARIICVADSFDVMSRGRAYRPARPVQDVVREILDQAGRQFDPKIAAALNVAWRAGRLHGIASPNPEAERAYRTSLEAQ